MKRITMFAVKREVLDALLADPEWEVRLTRAKNTEEIAQVVAAFCEATGRKVKEMDL